jgi:hypothetical protein
MPHIAPKTKAATSPFDINEPLRIIAREGINLLGIGGSNHEFNGLLSVMVEHDRDVDTIVELWRAAGYTDARGYGEPDGVHLDYADDDPGGLLAAVIRGRRHHPNGVVSDITVGVRTHSFWVDKRGDVVRDDEGYPMEDDSRGGERTECLPVQIYFLETPSRGDSGDPV